MVVGVATIELYLHGVQSLKQKRSIVRKIVHRVRNQFEISVAEVDHQDVHQSAAIGCAVVTNDARLANSVLSKVVDQITAMHLAEVSRADIEILHI